MSDHLHVRIDEFLRNAEGVTMESEAAQQFPGEGSDSIRAALDELVRRGQILRWDRDGVPGWSSIFFALHRDTGGWAIVSDALDEEWLQNELLGLEPFDFTGFVEHMLHANPNYANVVYPSDWNADLMAVDAHGKTTYFVTRRIRTTNERLLREVLDTRKELAAKAPDASFVLVVPGVLTAEATAFALAENLTVWDRQMLVAITPRAVVELYRAARRRDSSRDRGRDLMEKLSAIPHGREGWSDYQGIVTKLVEYLFVPPLGIPALELSNESGADRRDIIMANMAESGTWSLIRQLYRADYVVIDAKNHGAPLDKRPILDVSHYLKWYGPGLFALVACRQGFSDAGRTAAREQWIGSQRMIIPVTDDDFAEMVRLRRRRSAPEDVLVEAIRRFRLSL